MNDELYILLGIERTATPEEIKAAYRQQARTHHPDRGGNPDVFVRLTAAYNTLSDPEARAAYDESGKIDTDTPQKIQTRLMQNLSDLLEGALDHINGPVEEADVVGMMRQHASGVLNLRRKDLAARRKVLRSMTSVRNRIKRKGDGPNLFLDIIEQKLVILSKEFNEIEGHVADLTRVVDELQHYNSVVDMVRTMQASLFPSREDQRGFFQIFGSSST